MFRCSSTSRPASGPGEQPSTRVEEAPTRSATGAAGSPGSRAEIAQSVEGIQQLLEQRRANLAAASRASSGRRPASNVRPYKGLAAFQANDAADFFGRERLVAELVARLAGARLLAVVGPSGSGKSSLVRPACCPRWPPACSPASDGWRSVMLTPGADPDRAACRRTGIAEHAGG